MLSLLGAGQGQNSSFDADYQAVLNYATAQGYTLPSASQRVLQNALLVNLKNAGIWAKLDTFTCFATNGDSNFALIDWKRLLQYTAVNSPTFTTNQGFNGNGTSSYINSNYIPSTVGNKYTLNDCSFGYWAFSGLDTGGSKVNIGVRNNTTTGLTYIVGTNESTLFINSNSTLNGVLSSTSTNLGLRHFNRISSTGSRFLNSTGIVGTNTNTSGQLSSFSFYISTVNTGGVASGFTTTRISFVFAGSSLANENTAFNNALQTYISSL